MNVCLKHRNHYGIETDRNKNGTIDAFDCFVTMSVDSFNAHTRVTTMTHNQIKTQHCDLFNGTKVD